MLRIWCGEGDEVGVFIGVMKGLSGGSVVVVFCCVVGIGVGLSIAGNGPRGEGVVVEGLESVRQGSCNTQEARKCVQTFNTGGCFTGVYTVARCCESILQYLTCIEPFKEPCNISTGRNEADAKALKCDSSGALDRCPRREHNKCVPICATNACSVKLRSEACCNELVSCVNCFEPIVELCANLIGDSYSQRKELIKEACVNTSTPTFASTPTFTPTATTTGVSTPTISAVPSPGTSPTEAVTASETASESASASETPAPTPAATPEPSSVCFPSDARVHLEDGRVKSMSELETGDRVHVANSAYAYSDVYLFTHKTTAPTTTMVQVQVANGLAMIELSPGHYVPIAGNRKRLVAARTLKIGDQLSLANGTTVGITSVRAIRKQGLFNPQTLTGNIIVNGIAVTGYTDAVHPLLARILLVLPKLLYRAGLGEPLGAFLHFDNDWLAQAFPSGGNTVPL